jgi:hypothetical protein
MCGGPFSALRTFYFAPDRLRIGATKNKSQGKVGVWEWA